MRGRRALKAVAVWAVCAWAWNRPWIAPEPRDLLLQAHRGMAQEYDREGITGETCTAARMLTPRHGFLENTLPAIGEAFRLGADRFEVDVHPTTDGAFVVFHDWTLDCRTEGHGVTREHTLVELRGLDVGYGYTADGGATFPFRGQGVGLMPTLDEVLDAFPGRPFMINVKSDDPAEGALLADALARRPADLQRLVFSGGDAPMAVLAAQTGRPTLAKGRLKTCLTRYLFVGWTGWVPSACEDAVLYGPINAAPVLWGWPDVLIDRMARAGSEVVVVGPWTGGFSDGLDRPEDVARLPSGFRGGVATDKIEVVRDWL